MVQLILDTNILVTAARTGGPLPLVDRGDSIAVAAITIAELSEGILASKTPETKRERQEFLDKFLRAALVLAYTDTTAYHHAELLRHTRVTGQPRGAHDLIIAAHAKESGRTITTVDLKARFSDLPGVKVRQPTSK